MFHVLDKNNSSIVNYKATDLKTIENTVGKEFAEKISKEKGVYDYQGLDLKVGGKGMKGFYGEPSEGKEGIS